MAKEHETLIESVAAREILDSRGFPTVEADVRLGGGGFGRAAVPSGASTGGHEAAERRDGDESRYDGRGVREAVRAVEEEIAAELIAEDAAEQDIVDRLLVELDGTDARERLGANAILAVSLATAKAAADSVRMPLFRYLGGAMADTLPIPFFNVLNGGVHADNPLRIQEFMVAPLAASNFSEALRVGAEIHHALGGVLRARGLPSGVGDEGGFAPAVGESEAALDVIMEAIEIAGFEPGVEVGLALDAAANELKEDDGYRLTRDGPALSAEGVIETYAKWLDRFPALVSIEDGLAEDDFDGWAELTTRLGDRVQLVGDDLFATREERLRLGLERGCANAILVKPNQVGTLSETLDVIRAAQRCGYATMLSHRSGETCDASIAHIAVASGAGQIKAGAPCRGERLAKYNELLRIEEEIGDGARLAEASSVR